MQDSSSLSTLKAKQIAFVLEYVKLRNGTAAARAAGYQGSDKALSVQATRLLGNARVRNAIDELTRPAIEEAEVTVERVIEKLSSVAFAPWKEFVRVRMNEAGDVISATVPLRDQLSALKMLGEYLGMFDSGIRARQLNQQESFRFDRKMSPDEARETFIRFLRSR